ncbi:hypothetical protein KR054_000779, partial [Drosophila jambulina]
SSRWIYSRLKAELLSFADEFGFPGEGLVDDLRRNFATLVKDSEQTQEVWARLADLERRYTTRATSRVPSGEDKPGPSGLIAPVNAGVNPGSSSVGRSRTTPSFAVTAPSPLSVHRDAFTEASQDRSRREFVCVPERIRKCGLKLDGYSDPLAFVEQVESRALSYGIDLELLPRAMSELLTSRADKWFQTSRLQGADWTTFRREFFEFFLPSRYL